jgi:hypothetical protein
VAGSARSSGLSRQLIELYGSHSGVDTLDHLK